MNVKEQHVVTGMSRDSAVSQHNPNLVYDAHNIRITTKDGNNSLLSVTNERGTKLVNVASGSSQIVGVPIGSAAIGQYLVIFTHIQNPEEGVDPDHIYKCTIESEQATVNTIFSGNAKFSVNNPIETLPVYETDSIQKIYWVDGKNQPRVINIMAASITNADELNFSREVRLLHTMTISKTSSGGEFPTGSIQYTFSYYKKHGQETRLIDISPMYYLSPKTNGLDATAIDHSSFHIKISNVDETFDYVRLYAIVRTTENGQPICRVVGDYAINGSDLHMYDTGTEGYSIDATSLYFIGGEEIVAGTIAQKDNIMFLGNIKLTKPTLQTFTGAGVNTDVDQPLVYYKQVGNENNTGTDGRPSKSNNIYDYNPDNNRSSYYIKRFKYLETYRLGFIAQYKNGQWSEPFALADKVNQVKPIANENNYYTGGFAVTLNSTAIEALDELGFRRVAPVIVYPSSNGRRLIAQGLLSPTVSMRSDKLSNSPYAQSSWFFRLCGEGWTNNEHVGDNIGEKGEIQCLDSSCVNGNPGYNDKYNSFFFINTEIITMNTPEVECVDTAETPDYTDATCNIVGWAELKGSNFRTVDHFLETETIGVNNTRSQIIKISRTTSNTTQKSFVLYCDSPVDNTNTDEVNSEHSGYLIGWTVYPWHRQGSLNNQAALSTKQKSKGFTSRTAMIKRNITANSLFAHSSYLDNQVQFSLGGFIPKVFNSDQLAGVNVSGGQVSDNNQSFMYYGNIDKILTPANGKYFIRGGWCKSSSYFDNSNNDTVEQLSEIVPSGGLWFNAFSDNGTTISGLDNNIASDPVSMKYKSSPHIVLYNSGGVAFNQFASGNTGKGLFIAELIRDDDSGTPEAIAANIAKKFGGSITDELNNKWIRCGESAVLTGTSVTLTYLQGDCYFQRYDCLKTYPFTNEDMNSVIELFSTTLETYVNLDFRYDHNRGGSNNTAISPQNFNRYNHLAYEQTGNFFTYHKLDYDTVGNRIFNNVITWSMEKHFGEDVDTWASIDANNTLELDGSMGELKKIVNYNNELYTFQDIGFARLLFNSRVQIPTSDNTPIEITNGMKMDGKKYISTKVGCTNKWSIVETPMGLYFIDDILRTTYLFNGQLQDISSSKGMKSWMNSTCSQKIWNPVNFDNCKAFYDKVGKDIYWVYENTALVYSEILGQYMSFMDYSSIPLIENAGNSTFAVITLNLNPESFDVPIKNSLGVDGSIHLTAKSIPISLNLDVHVTEDAGQEIVPPVEVTWAARGIMRVSITINIANTDPREQEYAKYTIGEIITALEETIANEYFEFSLVNLNRTDTIYTSDQEWIDYRVTNNFSPMRTQSPFWEIGTGEYNMFFGEYKPYWLTFISNTNPTENKIFSTIEWRDIVKQGTTDKPLDTFDHARIWTEHQDTQSVAFTNSVTSLVNKQPIQYNAADSNLRKKFNVWRFQIPRDKLSWNRRARISNPWCYIKLSRDNINTERHELTDLVVNYLV